MVEWVVVALLLEKAPLVGGVAVVVALLQEEALLVEGAADTVVLLQEEALLVEGAAVVAAFCLPFLPVARSCHFH